MSRTPKQNSQQDSYNADSVEVLSYAEQIRETFLELYMENDIANVPERRKPKAIDSLWSEIYTRVLKPDKPQVNNCMSKVMPWDIVNIQSIIDVYVNLCNLYGGVIKFGQFAKLIGYSRYTLDYWHSKNNTGKYIFTLDSDSVLNEFDNNIYIVNSISDLDDVSVVHYKDNIYIQDTANYSQDVNGLSRTRLDVRKKLQQEMQDENTNALSVDTMGAAIRANNEEELGKLYEPKRMIQHEQIKQALSLNDLKLLDNTTNNTNGLLLDINGTDVHAPNSEE